VRKGNNTDEDAKQGRGADSYSFDARGMGKKQLATIKRGYQQQLTGIAAKSFVS
jgi:hypothetical protein